MKKVGIGVDYSNICKDYNTTYLDRDNTDPATAKCMKQVLTWTKKFLSEFVEQFDYKVHSLTSAVDANIDDIASKRFLFYSLEKEITLQSYVLQKEYVPYNTTAVWESAQEGSVLVQNDADGGSLYLFFSENSQEHIWVQEKLKDFSLDEVILEVK